MKAVVSPAAGTETVAGDPEELRYGASAFHNSADHLAHAAVLAHRAEVAPPDWWGPTADAHRAALECLAGSLRFTDELLIQGATALRAYAADIEEARDMARRAAANQSQVDDASARMASVPSGAPLFRHLAATVEHHQAQVDRWATSASRLAAEAAVRARAAFAEVATAASSPIDAASRIDGALRAAIRSLQALDHRHHGWGLNPVSDFDRLAGVGLSFAGGLVDGSVGLVDSLGTMGFDLPDLMHGRFDQWLGQATPLCLVQEFDVLDALAHGHLEQAGHDLLPNIGDFFPLNRSMLNSAHSIGEETIHHPGALAGSMVDWGDLSQGHVAHWLGELTPTAVAIGLTAGDGAGVRSLRALPRRIFGPRNGGLGELLPVPGKEDPSAVALAGRIRGVPQVRFANVDREFDAVSRRYIAQAKPADFTLNLAFRRQAKATFECALRTGRLPYFQFDGSPGPGVLAAIHRYEIRYGTKAVIDLQPLGG